MRNQKKTVKVVIITAVLGVCIYFLYYYASLYIADFVLKSMVKNEINGLIENGTLKIEDLNGATIQKDSAKGDKTDVKNSSGKKENTGNIGSQGDSTDNFNPITNDSNTNSTNPPTTDSSGKKTNGANNNTIQGQEAIEQKTNEVIDQVSDADKQDITKMVLSKLSSDDIAYLTGLLEGGLTNEEKKSAKNLAFSKFSADEIKKIYDYYKKYMG